MPRIFNGSYRKLNQLIRGALAILLVIALLVGILLIVNRPGRVRDLSDDLLTMPFSAENFVPDRKSVV